MIMSDIAYILSPDILIHRKEDIWILSNPVTRTHVSLDASFFTKDYSSLSLESDWVSFFSTLKGFDCTVPFFGMEGLHADPSGLSLSHRKILQGLDLLNLLKQRWILIEKSGEAYRQFLSLKKNILDRNHLGDFHQNIGSYLTLGLRLKDKWRWWHDQKFEPDGMHLRNNAYSFVQESFMKDYFRELDLRGKSFVDFGCGNGYYSRFLKEHGAMVIGWDTSAELLELARKNDPSIFWKHFSSNQETLEELGRMDEKSLDGVLMQDVLLLLMQPEMKDFLRALVSSFARVMKPGASFYMMEPHPVFWLASRYGSPQNQYALVSRYHHPVFEVAPTLEEILKVFSPLGFCLSDYREPVAPLGHVYHEEFPVWHFMKMTRL